MSLLEQEDLLCSLLEKNTEPERVTVLIGDELKRDEMKECSIVTASYNLTAYPWGA